jgi:hypothetical protein
MECGNMMDCGTWDLEERVEDAFVALLSNAAIGPCEVRAGHEAGEETYPLVIVHVEGATNNNDTGSFTGRRRMAVMVHIVTEAINENGVEGSTRASQTARTAHREFKSAVLGVLSGNQLQDELNELAMEGVAFSFAMMGEQRREAEGMYLTTHQLVDVIAQPKLVGG